VVNKFAQTLDSNAQYPMILHVVLMLLGEQLWGVIGWQNGAMRASFYVHLGA
jgi:hypothetical protein